VYSSFYDNLKRGLVIVAGIIMLSACTDSDYSLSEIDATIGFGADSLVLPVGSSTEDIFLEEFIDLNDCNFIKIDEDTYDYMLEAHSENGSITFRNVPEFLRDAEAKISLYNPSVNLNFYSPTEGRKISGRFLAVDDNGKTLGDVKMPSISLHKGNNVVSVREKNVKAGGDTITVVVGDLDDLTKKIPKTVTFTSTSLNPTEYYISCPLSFGHDAQIAYRDSIDGWNEALEKLCFLADSTGHTDSYIHLTAAVDNKVPAYLRVRAYALDINGDSISSRRVSVVINGTVKASKDGVKATESQVELFIYPKDNTVFKEMDGILFKFYASSDDANGKNPVEGIVINARYQTVTAHDIRVVVHGKVAGNFN